MLSQEELDKLLEEEGSGPSEDAGDDAAGVAEAREEGTAGAKGPIDQGDIDSLLDQGLEGPESDKPGTSDDLDWGDAFAEAAAGGDAAAAKAVSEGTVSEAETGAGQEQGGAPAASFSEFSRDDTMIAGDQRDNLDFILELPLEISVELGRKKIQIKDLLKLGQGSVVELNKMAGEPAEIYVNHKLMAKGEVVVVNEKFGVKLSEIISQADRVKSLG